MKKIGILFFVLCVSLVSFAANAQLPSVAGNSDSLKVWVFFNDKGSEENLILEKAKTALSVKALYNRERNGIRLDERDVPLNQNYINAISENSGRLLRKSRWLNAASFMILKENLRVISGLNFVKEVRPVKRLRAPLPPRERVNIAEFPTDSFYGASKLQNEMLAADKLHDAGFKGQGVLIGMLDSGFRLTHQAFDSLDLIAKYDFVHNDTTLDFQAGDGDYNGYDHGSKTLSCIGAYLPGKIIGVAYKASFALAKTEDVTSETVTEEDDWVAGIEWLDSLGADVVSSSLGYSTFDDDTPYTFAEMDGNTAVTTVAADIAASRGICVVNAAGNERNNPTWPHIVAPSDGDSVLAAAAVGDRNFIAGFSSPGPSADGRIKPDCSALGSGTIMVDPNDPTAITQGSGTSFACPLIAGLCAAVKSANPSLYGYSLALAVRGSGDRVRTYDSTYTAIDSADNDYGWGIPKGPVAAGLHEGFYGRIIYALTGLPICGDTLYLIFPERTDTVYSDTFRTFVDPLADSGEIFNLSVPGYRTVSDTVEGEGRTFYLIGYHTGFYGWLYDSLSREPIANSKLTIEFDTDSGTISHRILTYASGMFVEQLADSGDAYRIRVDGYRGIEGNVFESIGDKFYISKVDKGENLQLFPNPASEKISAVVFSREHAVFTVWSSDGTLVFQHKWMPGYSPLYNWDLRNENGKRVATGIYIVRLATANDKLVKKIAVTR